MARFSSTMGGDFDPLNAMTGIDETVDLNATSLDFGPGFAIEGLEDHGDQLVYWVQDPGSQYGVSGIGLTIHQAGLSGDSSDFDGVTRVTGGDFGDVFRTGDGNDVLNGGGGNDTLEGGRGTNTFDGGAGMNTLSYEHFDAPSLGGTLGVTITMESGSASDGEGRFVQDTFSNIANVRGSQYGDVIYGDALNNVIEGGVDVDSLAGGEGIDTLSFEHSSDGVIVDLQEGTGFGGDAEGDTYASFENILGSTSNDALYGDGAANTLYANGGKDELYGRDGDDRLVLSSSPAKVQGDEGTDLLFITSGSTVELTDDSFTGLASIEKVYVRDGATLSMLGVDVGTKIYSQSKADGTAVIVGTDGADRIVAGKGGDTLNGGQGGDVLFAGAGDNVFIFASGDGRDVICRFEAGRDVIDVSMLTSSMDGLKIGSYHGEANTIITFTGDSGPSDKIILLGVTADSVTEGSFVF